MGLLEYIDRSGDRYEVYIAFEDDDHYYTSFGTFSKHTGGLVTDKLVRTIKVTRNDDLGGTPRNIPLHKTGVR